MGWTIPPGGKTVETDFRFRNLILRLGLARELEGGGWQLGMQVRSVNYRLLQWNNIEGTKRNQREHWMEWVPSWGGYLSFPEFQVRYIGRMITGTGRPAVESGFWVDSRSVGQMGDSVDYLVAPDGPLTLQESRIVTHQIVVVIPLGR